MGGWEGMRGIASRRTRGLGLPGGIRGGLGGHERQDGIWGDGRAQEARDGIRGLGGHERKGLGLERIAQDLS